LFFTHLQSRFFTAAVPVLAVAACWPRWRWWPIVPGVAAVVGLAATLLLVPGKFVIGEFDARQLVGIRNPELVLSIVRGEAVAGRVALAADAGQTVTLVGDAEAWWYPAHVRYRSVFDAVGDDPLAAWRADEAEPGELIVIYNGYLRGPGANYVGVPQPVANAPALETRRAGEP
jgi:hypothetical protein